MSASSEQNKKNLDFVIFIDRAKKKEQKEKQKTSLKNNTHFMKPLFKALFEYIYRSWLFHSYCISIYFTKYGST